MTNETKHTPGPWYAIGNELYHEHPEFGSDPVGSLNGECSSLQDEANAAHIVKCVNMHDELVEILSKFMDFKDSDYVPNNMFKRGEEILKKAGEL